MVLYLLIAPLVFFVVFRLFHLSKNYIAARRYGLPIIIIPASFEDKWWLILRPLFKWVQNLPWGLGDWYVYTEMGWPTIDGSKTTKRLGENFVLCSPFRNQIATCYPPAVECVFGDHKNWSQPYSQAQMFVVYGQNLASTSGADWQRHRKITATAFNENSMQEVWKETIKRSRQLDLDSEGERSLARVRSTIDTLAMQVLAAVGFGQDRAMDTIPPGHRETLMQCLGFIHKHLIMTLLFSGLKAPSWLLPKTLQRLKGSVAEFQLYMEESLLLHMESSKTKSVGSRPTSLMESMVRANEAEKSQAQKGSGKPSYLSDSEVYGNIFVFNLAGYETTAGTMTFALPFLAANPDIQAWVIEEIDQYYKAKDDNDYTTIYPKMVRTLSIMYESLRLASPAPLLVRFPAIPTELPVLKKSGPSKITVTPDTLVGGHFYGGHLSSRWGDDCDIFDPKRFVSVSPTGDERLVVPDGPLYCPWIFGSRVCPGKKFSQVEFVAVVSQILSEYKLEILHEQGESEQAAKARLMQVLDGKYFNISTHLDRPEAAGLRFVPRSER